MQMFFNYILRHLTIFNLNWFSLLSKTKYNKTNFQKKETQVEELNLDINL